jgi:lipopolysaccharide heptosyltransferase II
MKPGLSSVQSILVIKLRAIGDVLLSTVVLKSLRAAYPDARIDFLTEKPARLVVEGNPNLNDVLVFDPKTDGGVRLIASVRSRKYDMVIDLFGNPRSAIVTAFSGAKFRVGYRFGWRERCYNIVIQPRGGDVHNTQFNLDALGVLDVPVGDRGVYFPCSEDARAFAAKFFEEQRLGGNFVVALNAGGGWITKRWRPHSYAALGDRLAKEFNAAILLVWGPGEESVARAIKESMSAEAVLIPAANLTQLAAILERCSAMVTNDSGPMHIASAMGTPVVAIFGPTRPDLQGPVLSTSVVVRRESLVCLGCNYTECPIGNPCMEELTVDEVFTAFTHLLAKMNLNVQSGGSSRLEQLA